MIELPIRRLRDDAVVPSRAYSGDAGLDLAACDRIVLEPGERETVGTGLAVAIPDRVRQQSPRESSFRITVSPHGLTALVSLTLNAS